MICEYDSTSPGHFSYTCVAYSCEPSQPGSGVPYEPSAGLPVLRDCSGT